MKRKLRDQNYSNSFSENPFAVSESPYIMKQETGEKLSALSMIGYEETHVPYHTEQLGGCVLLNPHV